MGIELEQFRAGTKLPPKKEHKVISRRQSEPFIKGPIPCGWMTKAASIPRRNALVVGIVLWWLAGMRGSRSQLVLCVKRCFPFGLKRKGVERGLRDLESAGLIRVERRRGHCVRVELLHVLEQEPKEK